MARQAGEIKEAVTEPLPLEYTPGITVADAEMLTTIEPVAPLTHGDREVESWVKRTGEEIKPRNRVIRNLDGDTPQQR